MLRSRHLKEMRHIKVTIRLLSMKLLVMVMCCRMPMFRICYGCGRSLGVKLTPCHKCHAVYFCSAECMKNAANAGHSAICGRVAGVMSFSSF